MVRGVGGRFLFLDSPRAAFAPSFLPLPCLPLPHLLPPPHFLPCLCYFLDYHFLITTSPFLPLTAKLPPKATAPVLFSPSLKRQSPPPPPKVQNRNHPRRKSKKGQINKEPNIKNEE